MVKKKLVQGSLITNMWIYKAEKKIIMGFNPVKSFNLFLPEQKLNTYPRRTGPLHPLTLRHHLDPQYRLLQ